VGGYGIIIIERNRKEVNKMAKLIKRTYTLRNIKTNETVCVCGMTMKEACANANLKAHQYRMVDVADEYETLTITKNLTNAQLIAILMQRDPSAEVDLMVDYSLWNASANYTEITEIDGLCYVAEYNQLVINAGEFEC
jgi:hypothetical protein